MYAKRNQLPMVGALLVCMFVLTCCRTYGGHGTEQATYDEIVQVVAAFEEDLVSARSELPALQEAAQAHASLQPFVHQFEEMLVLHAGIVEDHREHLELLVVKTGPIGRLSRSYRDLNQSLGALLAEQQELRIGYETIAMDVRSAVLGGGFRVETPVEIGRYQIVPPYYEKLRYALERARLDLDTSLAG